MWLEHGWLLCSCRPAFQMSYCTATSRTSANTLGPYQYKWISRDAQLLAVQAKACRASTVAVQRYLQNAVHQQGARVGVNTRRQKQKTKTWKGSMSDEAGSYVSQLVMECAFWGASWVLLHVHRRVNAAGDSTSGPLKAAFYLSEQLGFVAAVQSCFLCEHLG